MGWMGQQAAARRGRGRLPLNPSWRATVTPSTHSSRNFVVISLFLFCCVSGCQQEPISDEEPPSISGGWYGAAADLGVQVTLQQSGTQIRGVGAVRGPRSSAGVVVTGFIEKAFRDFGTDARQYQLQLLLTPNDGAPLQLAAIVPQADASNAIRDILIRAPTRTSPYCLTLHRATGNAVDPTDFISVDSIGFLSVGSSEDTFVEVFPTSSPYSVVVRDSGVAAVAYSGEPTCLTESHDLVVTGLAAGNTWLVASSGELSDSVKVKVSP